MLKRSQTFKIVATFILTFFLGYGILKFVSHQLLENQKEEDKIEANIIQQEIRGRFSFFLDIALVVGQISSEYLQNDLLKKNKEYGSLLSKMFPERDYLLGVNRLDSKGAIVHIYPEKDNSGATGKVSQNYSLILDSFKRNEPYWFSPPFHLFQGGMGFAFYVPIVKNNQLHGWVASVIRSQNFFDHFRSMEYFTNYELIIRDAATDGIYFSTALNPPKNSYQSTSGEIRGRTIVMQSWRKKDKGFVDLPYYWYVILCSLLGLTAAAGVKFYDQKKKAYLQLENIGKLLRLTARDALNKLIDIHSEYLSIGSTGYLRTSVVEKDIESITNMIEQIDLLQTMAESDEVIDEEFSLLPIIKELLDDLEEIIFKKDLKITVVKNSLKDVLIHGNKWLVRNTVLKNILSHCMLFSAPEKAIHVSFAIATSEENLVIRLEEVMSLDKFGDFNLDRRLFAARKAMRIMNGDIIINQNNDNETVIKIIFKSN